MTRPTHVFALLTLAIALPLAYAADRGLIAVMDVSPWQRLGLAWLCAISLVTLLTFAYDKAIAGGTFTRVPERVLLGQAALGGTLAAWLAMSVLRHKTRKRSFRRALLAVTLLQCLAAGAAYMVH